MANMKTANKWLAVAGIFVMFLGLLKLLQIFFSSIWSIIQSTIFLVNRFSWPILLIAIGLFCIYVAKFHEVAPTFVGKKLYRSRSDMMLTGLIGGVAEYFGVSSLFLRILFILALLCSPVTVFLLYAIMAFVVLRKPE